MQTKSECIEKFIRRQPYTELNHPPHPHHPPPVLAFIKGGLSFRNFPKKGTSNFSHKKGEVGKVGKACF